MKKPNDYLILPEIISKEPLAPAVRHGDDQWLDVVKWSIYAIIEAEELNINSKNVKSFLRSKIQELRRFLGVSRGNGKALGLEESWESKSSHVGNYSEIFERHVGKFSS